MNIYVIAFLTFIATMIGGWLVFKYHDKLSKFIIPFSAGIFISVSFLDLLPESFKLNNNSSIIGIFIAVGFLLFYVLQRFTIVHAHYEEDCEDKKHEHIGIVGASGLIFHSFLDGLAIGLAFAVSVKIALIVSLAVIAHKIGDGIGLVSLMLHHKNSSKKSWIFLIIAAIVPIIGILSANFISLSESTLGYILAFIAGFFIYIGASDLLPEAHKGENSFKILIATITGFLFIYLLTIFVTI